MISISVGLGRVDSMGPIISGKTSAWVSRISGTTITFHLQESRPRSPFTETLMQPLDFSWLDLQQVLTPIQSPTTTIHQPSF